MLKDGVDIAENGPSKVPWGRLDFATEEISAEGAVQVPVYCCAQYATGADEGAGKA